MVTSGEMNKVSNSAFLPFFKLKLCKSNLLLEKIACLILFVRWTEVVGARQPREFNKTLDLFSNFDEGIDTWKPVFSAEHHSQQLQLGLAYRCAVATPSARLTLAALACRSLGITGTYKSYLCGSSMSFLQLGCFPAVVVPDAAVFVVRRLIQMQVFPRFCRFTFMFSENEARRTNGNHRANRSCVVRSGWSFQAAVRALSYEPSNKVPAMLSRHRTLDRIQAELISIQWYTDELKEMTLFYAFPLPHGKVLEN